MTENLRQSVPRPVRFYSDVVRACSPAPDVKVEQESNIALDAITSVEVSTNVNEMAEGAAECATFRTAQESSVYSSESEDGDDRPWITVGRKSRRGRNTTSPRTEKPEGLTDEQLRAVNEAKKGLTEDESLRLSRREASVSRRGTTMTEPESRDEGPSKGKGVDPKNWGALVDDEEIDVEAQHAAFESYKLAKEMGESESTQSEGGEDSPSDELPSAREPTSAGRHSVSDQRALAKAIQKAEKRLRQEYDQKLRDLTHQAERHKKQTRRNRTAADNPVEQMVNRVVNPETSRREKRRTPQAMEPVRQVAPKSYIGQALGRLGRDADGDDSWGSPSDSSSDSSSTSSSSSESERARRKRKSRAKKRSKSRKTTLKPIAPTVYDGAVDSRAFHRFITEGTAYVKDGRVASRKRVFVLSHYLKGKAHEFYIREISGDPYRWRLREFFTEMFNYCFPINFRTKQREKLKRCFQNDKPVRDYVYELNELWNMIGDVDERDRVTRLWTGLSSEIQRELWKKELNPEISTFKEVQAAAEIIEIAHSVPMGREKRSGQKERATTVVSANATTPVKTSQGKRGNSPSRRGRDRRAGQPDKSKGTKTQPDKGASKGAAKDNPRRRNDLSPE
jgi:hypothetical protein